MKRVMVSLAVLIAFLFLIGCLDYKAYEVPKENISAKEDGSLVKSEIAEIEKQLEALESASNASAEVEGKVVIPKLSENKTNIPEEAFESNLQLIKVKENQLVRLKLSVSDPNNDKVEYSFSKPLDKKGEWKTTYGDAGEYVVTITASDGKLTTEKKLKMIVERINVPPIVENLKNLMVSEGDLVKIEPKVSDPNHDPVTVTISDPLSKGIWQTDSKSSGDYNIKVVASDGELKTEKVFKLSVKNVNLLPVISNLNDITAKEGQLIKLEPVVTDADKDEGETLTVTYSSPFSKDGTWTPSYTSHGVYPINVTANDGRGGVTSKFIKVTIEAVNMPPVIENVTLELR